MALFQKQLPTILELRSIHETWVLNYEAVKQQRFSISHIDHYQLLVKGNIKQYQHCVELLQQWLKRKAKQHLNHWLLALSDDTALKFTRLSVRGQKTRWGSCSTKQSINLNYKLLFLPALLVEHVLLHELCHTKVFNHSTKFWSLLSEFDGSYKENRRLLREAHQFVPHWII